MSATKPSKLLLNFFEFRWGNASDYQYYRVVNDVAPWALGRDVYTPVPTAYVDMPEQGIGLNEQPAKIFLPLDVNGFSGRMTDGTVHAPVTVRIREKAITLSEPSSFDVRTIYVGRIVIGARNKDGNSGIVELSCQTPKDLINFPLGNTANHHCSWALGGNGCFKNLLPLRQDVIISDIAQTRVTLTESSGNGVQHPPGDDPGYWINGHIEWNGLILIVKDWDGVGTNQFTMRDVVPQELDGEHVFLYPGCDKLYQTCDARFNNIGNFGGIGIGIPDKNPIYELIV